VAASSAGWIFDQTNHQMIGQNIKRPMEDYYFWHWTNWQVVVFMSLFLAQDK